MSALPLTHHFWLTRRRRIVIMIGLIMVFFVVAPAVLLYTAGFRYDWASHRLLGTGVISLDLKPNDAAVFVNDIKINKKMPIRLSNTAPGVYNVRIEKPDYHPWQQDMTVTSNQTTFIRDVQLYRDMKPIEVRPDLHGITAGHATPSPNLLVVTREHEEGGYAVDYVTLGGTLVSLIATSSPDAAPPEIFISPQNQAALIVTNENAGQRLIFASLLEPDTRTLGWLPANSPLTYEWAPDEDDTLYLQLNDKIIAHRASDSGDTLIAVATSSPWFVDDRGEVWKAIGPELWHRRQGTDTLAATTPAPITRILAVNKQRALVAHNDAISIITFAGDRVNVETNNLTHLSYFPEKDEWLAWSAWELWSVYSDGRTALLLRATNPITAVLPLDKFGALLIASQKGLDAFNPGYYVTERLVDLEAFDMASVDRKNRLIYFVGKIKGEKNLFKLEY